MATEIGNIYYSLDLDDKKFNQGLNDAKTHAHGLGGSLDKATGASAMFTTAVVGAGVAGIAFGVGAVNAFNQSAQALAQLDAVLKSTGDAAGVTKEQVIALSDSWMAMTGISDEAIISGENMLLTFTNIGKDIFPDATRSMLDMATAMNGGAIPSSEELRAKAILLGKALQDPDAGLGALKRVGVNVDELSKKFNDGMTIQEKQILILQELNTEFGGSAEAAGKTFAGQLSIAKEQFGNLMEKIGEGIVNNLKPLVDAFNKWFIQAGGVDGVMEKLNKKIQEITPYLPVIIGAILGGMVPAMVALAIATWSAVAPLLPFIAVGALLGLAVKYIIDHFGGLDATMKALQPTINTLKQAWDVIAKVFNDIIMPALKDIWKQIETQLMPALKDLWKQVSPILIPALKIIAVLLGVQLLIAIMILIGVIKLLIWFFTEIAKQISTGIQQFKDITKAVVDFFIGLYNATIASGKAVLDWFASLPQMVNDAITQMGLFISNGIASIVQFFIDLPYNVGLALGTFVRALINFVMIDIPNFVNGIINFITQLPSRIATIFTNIITNISNAFINMVSSAKQGAINVINGVMSFITQLPGRIWNALSGLGGTIFELMRSALASGRDAVSSGIDGIWAFFRDLPSNIWNALSNLGNMLYNLMKKAGSDAWNGFKKGMGISSPSFIEKALANITTTGKQTVEDLRTHMDSLNKMPNMFNAQMPLMGMARAGGGNTGSVTTNFYGGVNLGSDMDVNRTMGRLSRNEELAFQGLTVE